MVHQAGQASATQLTLNYLIASDRVQLTEHTDSGSTLSNCVHLHCVTRNHGRMIVVNGDDVEYGSQAGDDHSGGDLSLPSRSFPRL